MKARKKISAPVPQQCSPRTTSPHTQILVLHNVTAEASFIIKVQTLQLQVPWGFLSSIYEPQGSKHLWWNKYIYTGTGYTFSLQVLCIVNMTPRGMITVATFLLFIILGILCQVSAACKFISSHLTDQYSGFDIRIDQLVCLCLCVFSRFTCEQILLYNVL